MTSEDPGAPPEEAASVVDARAWSALLVLVAALVAAALLPGAPPGINLPLVALVGALAVHRARLGHVSRTSWAYVGLGFLLAASAAVRGADWIVAVNVLAALWLAAFAATGARTWQEHVWAPFAMLGVVPRVPTFLRSALPPASAPPGRLRPVLRGAALGLLLVTVFGTLFGTADAAFARLMSRVLVPAHDLGLLPVRIVVLALAGLVIGSLAAVRARGPSGVPVGLLRRPSGVPGNVGATEWTVAIGSLDALFAVFVGVQITVLFGGHAHVLETAGVTYSGYAREGFLQLAVASVLVVAVLAAAAWSCRGLASVRRLRVAGGLLCALTFVVLASAMHRLALYEEQFGYTRDRLTVRAILWWIAGVLVAILLAGAAARASWLARGIVVWSAVALLAFSAVNPDALVAERNIGRHARSGRIGLGYLRSKMSADAVPALLRLREPLRSCVLEPLRTRLAEPDPWYAFNLSRARARTLLAEAQLETAAPCAPAGEGT